MNSLLTIQTGAKDYIALVPAVHCIGNERHYAFVSVRDGCFVENVHVMSESLLRSLLATIWNDADKVETYKRDVTTSELVEMLTKREDVQSYTVRRDSYLHILPCGPGEDEPPPVSVYAPARILVVRE